MIDINSRLTLGALSLFMMVFLELIGTFIIAMSIVYIYCKYVIFNFWRKKNVFCLKPVIPIGNITDVVTGKIQFGVFMHDIYMKYKNHRAIGLYVFLKPNLLITDLDLIRIVLTKEFKSFHDRGIRFNEKINPLLDNLFCMSGKKWRNLRVKMTPTFSSGKIKQMFLIMKESSQQLAKYLDSKAQMAESVDMKDMFGRYSTDVIMSTAFGIKSNCIEEPNNEYRIQGKTFFKIKIIWFLLFNTMPQIMNFFSVPIMDRHVTNFFINMFEENVKFRRINNIVRHDFINLLMQLMDKGYVNSDDDTKADITCSATANNFTITKAVAQSFAFFIAGFETSSVTATFALFELAQHHDIQDKVRQEVDKILEKHVDLTYDAVTEMTYLHKVINETMRKYPPLPMLSRVCTKEIDIPTTNIHLPKGTAITIPVLGLHRDPLIYPDPDKFDPERFNADEIAKRHPYAYLPFGEGPRICIGARFGYMQTKIGLVNLLSKYKFKLHPRTVIPLTFNEKSFGLAVKGGIHFIIEPR